MKILSLIWGFSLGGIGKCVLTYDRLNEYSEFTVHTACIYLRNTDCDLAPLHDIGASIIEIENRRDFSWIAKTFELIDDREPDLLFVHGFNGPVVARLLQWKSKRPLPFVCSYHGEYHAPTTPKKLIEPVYNYVQEYIYRKHTNAVTTCADYCKVYLKKRKVPPSKVSVIHNGITDSDKDITVSRKELNISDDAVVFGIASRIDPVKGIDYLMQAFQRVASAHANAFLLVVGDGTSRKELETFAQRSELRERVIFLGYQQNVGKWLSCFDVFVLPSLAEYHSIALLEAMRAGKAIIATDVGGNTESVRHRREALIVPPADSAALAEAMRELIGNPDLRSSLSAAARQRFVAEFTEDRMLEKLAKWFRGMSFGTKNE